MANTKTLGQLIAGIRQRADMQNSQFVTDVELADYVNQAIAELYTSLTTRFQDYYAEEKEYSLPADNGAALPDGFFKCLGVDLVVGGRTHTLRPYMWSERNIPTTDTFYRIQGNTIRFIPETTTSGTVTLWYVPEPQYFEVADPLTTELLAKTLATVDSQIQRGYEEYVILDAAIKCLIKEESDATALIALRERVRRQIEEAGETRSADESYRIADISTATMDFPLGYGRIAGGGGVSVTFKTIKVGSTEIVADSSTDTLELIAGSGILLTGNATDDSVTIAASGGGAGGSLTVQESGGSPITNVSTIKFDDDSSGFSVAETETCLLYTSPSPRD